MCLRLGFFKRFLCDLLSSLVSHDYSCKDTFSFVFQIKNASLSEIFLPFCDVTSLVTNNPLQETIDTAISLIFNHNPNLNITRTTYTELLFNFKSFTSFSY